MTEREQARALVNTQIRGQSVSVQQYHRMVDAKVVELATRRSATVRGRLWIRLTQCWPFGHLWEPVGQHMDGSRDVDWACLRCRQMKDVD